MEATLPKTCQVHFKIIPSIILQYYHSNQISLDYYLKLSFNIYSQFHKNENEPLINSQSSTIYCPPYFLSSPPPIQINYKMTNEDVALFDNENTLHLTYSWGADYDCVIAVWIDRTAQYLDHILLPVDKKAFKDYSFLVDQLFQATKKFQAKYFKHNVRLAITKLGVMEITELESWKKLIKNIPGSCIMCAGQSSGLQFFSDVDIHHAFENINIEASSLIITETRVPLSKNLYSSAVGILSYEGIPAINLEVFLLYNTFQIASPPSPLIPSFRTVLAQLNDLRVLDNSLRPPFSVGFHPNLECSNPILCDVLLPLPWRWVLSSFLHIEYVKKMDLV
ncbi:hypothetical protein K502DRAFT_224399 [Neoconidiobolus thromboides FSU 785]|nr:hypothetical protein K502DRAFT_224399 [Neoconidiobolus thromboides FSU 785]